MKCFWPRQTLQIFKQVSRSPVTRIIREAQSRNSIIGWRFTVLQTSFSESFVPQMSSNFKARLKRLLADHLCLAFLWKDTMVLWHTTEIRSSLAVENYFCCLRFYYETFLVPRTWVSLTYCEKIILVFINLIYDTIRCYPNSWNTLHIVSFQCINLDTC